MPRNDTSRVPALGGKSKHNQTQAPRLGGDAVLTHLIAALQDADITVRERALEALEEIGSEEALDLLIQSSRDQHVSVRRRAFGALARLQGDAVAAALRGGLNDPDEPIRYSAIAGIGLQHDPQDGDALLHIMRHDELTPVRIAAAMALAEIGDLRAMGEIIQNAQRLHPNWRGFAHALRRLYERHPQQVTDAIAAHIFAPGNDFYYSSLFPALNLVRPAELLPFLIRTAQAADQSIGLRGRAIRAIAEMQAVNAAPVLLQVIKNPAEEEKVRIQAARMVGRLRSPEVAPALIEVMLAGGTIATAAAVGLRYNRDSGAVPALLDLLEHEDWMVRRRTIEILRPRKLNESVPAIMDRLTDSRAGVREMAVRALGFIRPPEALPALIQRLHEDPVVKVRRFALEAIHKYNDPNTLPALAAALADPADNIRVSAIIIVYHLLSLHQDQVSAVREMLLTYQGDTHSTVRHYVNRLLEGRFRIR
jgi:HEAT repeat protein